MNVFLILGLVGCLLASIGTFLIAKSAVHEIEALLWLLIAAVLFSGIAVRAAVNAAARRLTTLAAPTLPPPVISPVATTQPPLPPSPPQAPQASVCALHTLRAADLEEAQRYLTALRRAGYTILPLPPGWEITNPAGRVAATVTTLEELQQTATELAPQDRA